MNYEQKQVYYNLTLLGTIRKNKPELPKELVTTHERNEYSTKFGYQDKAMLASYCPKKGKIDSGEISTGEKKKPQIIIIIIDYNKTKSGVDTMDKLLRTYTVKRQTRRWPMTVFYNMIDISALNAYIIWVHLNEEWKTKKGYKRREFLKQLGKELVANGISTEEASTSQGHPQKTRVLKRVLGAVQSGGSAAGNSLSDSSANRGLHFDTSASKNVTALLGKTAYLNCRVKNLANRTISLQVSWVRHRDVHLLTVGHYTYTSDQRFRAIHQPHSEDWTLQIKYPQHRDSGIYECQISSTPHLSHFIHLTVIEPDTEIVGAPELYIDRGSTINLTCVVRHSPEPPAYIFWNHNDAIISYSSSRGGVSVATERGETSRSVLLIQKARASDSGNYQCNPSNARPANVTVHVLNGEHPEAMQHGGNQRMGSTVNVFALFSIVLLTYC